MIVAVSLRIASVRGSSPPPSSAKSMTVAFFVPHSRTLASTDDDTVSAPDTIWTRYRPIVVALPVFMLLSYIAWLHDRPEGLAPLAVSTWLILCFAGAVAPLTTFALALRLSDRRPLLGGLSWSSAGVHVLALFAGFGVTLFAHVIVPPRSPIPVPPHTPSYLLLEAGLEYILLALACQGVRTIRDAKKAEAARARLRADLIEAGQRRAEAELRALKAELNPHFLGNALQGVKALMRSDVDAAHSVITSLADLLRTTLTRAGTQETTLREEIETLGPFIDVERTRLRGRLELQFEIDESTLDLLVPDMILQPLVENAVKHGLIPFGGGRIRIAAHAAPADSGSLEILVEDDGVALGSVGTTRSSKQGGTGLANIRARLAALYANQASLELTRGGLGTLVRVTLPSRDADTAEPLGIDTDDATLSMGSARRVRFVDQTWASRGWRLLTIGATLWLWVSWMTNSVASNTRNALAKGLHDKQAYAIVDGVIVGTLMIAMVCLAFSLSRRVPVVAQGAKDVLGAARRLLFLVMTGVACAAAICVVKASIAFGFHYSVILQWSHLKPNLARSMFAITLTFLAVVRDRSVLFRVQAIARGESESPAYGCAARGHSPAADGGRAACAQVRAESAFRGQRVECRLGADAHRQRGRGARDRPALRFVANGGRSQRHARSDVGRGDRIPPAFPGRRTHSAWPGPRREPGHRRRRAPGTRASHDSSNARRECREARIRASEPRSDQRSRAPR